MELLLILFFVGIILCTWLVTTAAIERGRSQSTDTTNDYDQID